MTDRSTTMIPNEIKGLILDWHQRNGGHAGRPAGHALRILREVVELCVASGATQQEISHHVFAEVDKAAQRGEFRRGATQVNMAEEVADTNILLTVFNHHNKIDEVGTIAKKLETLEQRQWEADQDGVLWRPGTRT